MRRLLLLFAALGVLVTLAGGGGGARHAATTASEGEALIPVPGPRERSEALPPGALPAAFSYRYASNFRGWPVAPLHRAHPIRGAFLEPRLGGYHFGVDIPVDDLHPDPGAPRGHTHRVYAVDSGNARVDHRNSTLRCQQRRLQVGKFAYWHVDPIVADGEHVIAGQPIGWTCTGRWHLHLAEWAVVGGKRVFVNPLHRGGKLIPYSDTSVPELRSLRFFTPERQGWHWLGCLDSATELSPDALRGRVELRVRVVEAESFTGWLGVLDPRLPVPEPPYRLSVRVTDAHGNVVLRRTAFQSDRMPDTPVTVHFAPGTREDLPLRRCIPLAGYVCARQHWYRPFSRQSVEYWDTRTAPDGEYTVTVTAWGIRGNKASSTIPVVVANRSEGSEAAR